MCTSEAESLQRLSDQGVTQLPSTPTISAVSISSSSAQAHLLPSTSSAIPMQCESQSPIPLSTSATSSANNLEGE
ncbi:hypothetical protein TNCV_4084501 [Trichonephila clavipes]|nr:hypothetical protein TNCV_4084501 [Trichonephila clavipes]